eukprot:TRINITY_DN12306_c0_g1_i1.p1 TRINITY_DN12306_c0_g1~~TRINITY_DN12306_c0_g1_i1.p1  ORF type:complete len:406 (-),score=79.06 TRINITY_DN12306_c0_g1_i1:63-1253(-)
MENAKTIIRRSVEKLSVWSILVGTPLLCSIIATLCFSIPVTLNPGSQLFNLHDRSRKFLKSILSRIIVLYHTRRLSPSRRHQDDVDPSANIDADESSRSKSIVLYPFKWVFGLYVLWAWTFDRMTGSRGGRKISFLRNLFIWEYWRSYFSMSVVHDGEIDPSPGNVYVFGVHPHGVMSAGAWGNLIAHNPNALPEDLNYRVLTISLNFQIPIWREIVMGLGLVDASRDSVKYLLSKGISVCVIVGGAEEALDSRPRTLDLTLDSRKGFVRLALEHGAKLVPVISFGETDIFEQVVPNPPGSAVRSFQERLKDLFGYSLPLVRGRLFLGIPLRRPITTVFGKPIEVPKIEQPTPKDLAFYHALYKKALAELYAKYKDEVYPYEHEPMRIVDEVSPRL